MNEEKNRFRESISSPLCSYLRKRRKITLVKKGIKKPRENKKRIGRVTD